MILEGQFLKIFETTIFEKQFETGLEHRVLQTRYRFRRNTVSIMKSLVLIFDNVDSFLIV